MESKLVLEPLGTADCWERLRSRRIGRVGITLGALPVILPVFYAVVDERIVFSTGSNSRLAGATAGVVVAFEADDYEDESAEGWSVLLQGVAEEIVDPEELEGLSGLGLRSVTGAGRESRYMAIPATTLNGRTACSEDRADPSAAGERT